MDTIFLKSPSSQYDRFNKKINSLIAKNKCILVKVEEHHERDFRDRKIYFDVWQLYIPQTANDVFNKLLEIKKFQDVEIHLAHPYYE